MRGITVPPISQGLEKTEIANLGAYKRYREFGGKEQRAEPRVREFHKFGTASLRGITVTTLLLGRNKISSQNEFKY